MGGVLPGTSAQELKRRLVLSLPASHSRWPFLALTHARSIDVDTTDIWILDAMLSVFRPRVVSIEYNSHFGPNVSLSFPDATWMPVTNAGASFVGTCYYGSSAGAIQAAAHRCGTE